MKPEDQILVHRIPGEALAVAIDRQRAPAPGAVLLDYSELQRAWTKFDRLAEQALQGDDSPAAEHGPPVDPFIAAVEATLAPAPPNTRRVYYGGGL